MGHTLYDTIYLGRSRLYYSNRTRMAVALGVAAGASLGWLVWRALR